MSFGVNSDATNGARACWANMLPGGILEGRGGIGVFEIDSGIEDSLWNTKSLAKKKTAAAAAVPAAIEINCLLLIFGTAG